MNLTDAIAPALMLGFLMIARGRWYADWVKLRDERLPKLLAADAVREIDKLQYRSAHMDGVRDLAKAWLFSAVVMAVLHAMEVI